MFGLHMLTKLVGFLKTAAKVGLSLGILVLLGLYSYQSSLIYPASLNDGHGHCATPDEYDMEYKLVHLTTKDGEVLQCYLLKHDPTAPDYKNKTVLILSPNAGNIGHSLPIVSIFYKTFGYNVFIYSYRGYGKSTGKPSEVGLKIDAERVVRFLTSEDDQFKNSSLVLYGRSLGGAVAIYISAIMPDAVCGIVLENTFLSLRKTVPHIFPFLKYFTSFVHQKWDSESLMPLIPSRIPIAMFSARKDEIVPPPHMDQLYALLKSSDKVMYKFDNSTHNDTVVQTGYWEKVEEFIEEKV